MEGKATVTGPPVYVMDALLLTSVLVTHDADRARRLGHRGVRLEGGRVVQWGEAREVVGEV